MNVAAYVGLIPQIEEWLGKAKLDALVLGLGPTAWLARYLKRDLTRGLRLFGAHDVHRILPVHDLVILDNTICNHAALGPDGERHAVIVNSRPDRLWIYTPNVPDWDQYIHTCMRPVMQAQMFTVWDVHEVSERSDFRIGETQPTAMMCSPAGCATLAWHQGCRRIGILGMDLVPGKHHASGDSRHLALMDTFMCRIAAEAAQKGGAILNLSPIHNTGLPMFAQASQYRLLAS